MGAMGLGPEQFWRLTMREFWLMHEHKFGTFAEIEKKKPMTRSRLDELIEADKKVRK